MKFFIRYFFSFDINKVKFIIFSKRSIIKIVFETFDDMPYINIYLFKIRIFRKKIIAKGRKRLGIDALKIVNTTDIKANISYGFDDPFITGLLFGILGVFFEVKQYPNFIPQQIYIIVDGSANIYIWATIVNYFKYKRKVVF